MRANEHQVGGRHYKTEFEHWDLVLATGMGYLEGCATKYAARWRKKGGAEDLKKALHYLNKLDEERLRAAYISPCRPSHATLLAEVERFAAANGLDPLERAFVERVATWQVQEDISEARVLLFQLMDAAGEPVPAAAPVPLTEQNHHAQREGQSDEEYNRD